jgi:two-component system cell cycle sensor histidine kinase/response regulator CckA
MEWSEELSGGLLRAAPDAILVMATGGQIVLVSDRAEEMFGCGPGELLGRSAETLLSPVARDGYDEQMQRSGGLSLASSSSLSLDVLRLDGSEFPAEISMSAVPTEQGRMIVAVVRDISERQRAETEQVRLRAEAERQRLEAQLHRTRRLESLGQLAGGVAHDFNNMLGVIVNYAGFVIEEAGAAAPDVSAIVSDAEQIVRAGQRGTDLTHQLLSFARREVIRPQVLDLNAALAEVEQLLRRSLGEHITLITRPMPGLPAVTADPGQIEQVLVNLAVNARDAMPAGGRLVIDTGVLRLDDADVAERIDLKAGEYVRLRVGDSGTGMPPDVVERAFEPFFTTKSSGEGTGLGLATVYGIVAQAGGGVSIASEQGVGSTVTVLLPTTTEEIVAAAPHAGPPTDGHGETLLVVEDEDALRDVAGRILVGAGYRVLSAEGGAQALDVAAGHDGTIDLLVSDVVMPGMLGKDLAERLVALRPDTRVLYMSGYAQPVLASQGTLDPGVVLLEKPFTAADLLRAVRHRLDGRIDGG